MGQQPNIEPGLGAAPRTKLGPGAARSWRPRRPAEVVGPQANPAGGMFGVTGPDAGYALKLVAQRELKLQPGEHHHDAAAAVAAIATARAARLGRAPIAADVAVAAVILGMDPAVPADEKLLGNRPGWIANVGHDAPKLRSIVADVPAEILSLEPQTVVERVLSGWVYRGEDK